ncbi:hypothetical protein D3C84_394180 [compost metagenome]
MGQVATGEGGAGLALLGLALDAGQEGLAAGDTALADAAGHFGDHGMGHRIVSNTEIRARSTGAGRAKWLIAPAPGR